MINDRITEKAIVKEQYKFLKGDVIYTIGTTQPILWSTKIHWNWRNKGTLNFQQEVIKL